MLAATTRLRAATRLATAVAPPRGRSRPRSAASRAPQPPPPHHAPSPAAPPSPRPPPARPPPPRGIAAALGLAGGALGASAGIGGAVFIVPGLVRYCALAQPTAAGSAMMAVVAVSATSASAHAAAAARDGRVGVCWSIAALLAVPAALASPFGATLAPRVKPRLLRRTLGFFLLGLAPILPLRAMLAGRAGERQAGGEAAGELSATREVKLVAGGAAIGFGAGMLGMSGGALMTPLIAVLHPDLPMSTIVGTSFAAMLPPSVVGAITYSRLGLVSWPLVVPLLVGAVGGAAIGSRIVLNLPDDVLRWGFATVFFALGLRIVRAPITPAVKRPPL